MVKTGQYRRPGPHFAFRTDPINASGCVSFHTASGQGCFSILLADKKVWVQPSRVPLASPSGGWSSRLRSRVCYVSMSWAIQSLLIRGQRTLLFCSIKWLRVIIAEITLLNNTEVCLFLLSFLSSEVGNLSTKTCCASLSALSVTGRAWGLGPEGLVCLFVPLGLEEHRFYLCCILFFFIFHLKAIQQFVSWSRRQSFAPILTHVHMLISWSVKVQGECSSL